MNLQREIDIYLDYCKRNKGLNDKTIKAYKTDLKQFREYYIAANTEFGKQLLVNYIGELNMFKPKTAKRKIATLKAFCSYLEYEDIVEYNPFHKIKTKLKEPIILPKTIPAETICRLFCCMYELLGQTNISSKEYLWQLRDICAIELMFSTGARISEICSLHRNDVTWIDMSIKIYGKGSRERIVYVSNNDVVKILKKYYTFTKDYDCDYLFVNRLGKRLSEQSLRFALYKYAEKAGITQHITPHMFRHSFATMMLDENVDIRYIQCILGHSSITTTQIYTHVSVGKQKEIMLKNNPRNIIKI